MKAQTNVRRNLSNPQDPTDTELQAMTIKTGLDILAEKAQAGDDAALKELRETAIRSEARYRALDQSRASNQFPDPPIVPRDIPNNPPAINVAEIVAYGDAEYTYRIARADFEMKHAAIVLKLLLGSKPEEGSSQDVRLDKDFRLIFSDSSSSGPPEITRS